MRMEQSGDTTGKTLLKSLQGREIDGTLELINLSAKGDRRCPAAEPTAVANSLSLDSLLLSLGSL